ncbi:SMC-Scp complex subunit ScpB [Rhizobium sp. MHM7A]|uniref:SMC-Scp complex subunit ScpB n=1 Tax=Rhizobium sp. MHM7A TaxID=2583233 RepID=UPI001107185C|nr:SMC-Scp complex subunit ScpB [Rhizobium sp. MHM7A]TLX16862.1 SMC-Scp complex subunit ScpB [Rhizobium sp. MHM7A]
MSDIQIADKFLVEALLFSSGSSVTEEQLQERLPALIDVRTALQELQTDYEGRSFTLSEISPCRWAIRTRPEHSDLCRELLRRPLKLSKATIETLYVIAYFQPVTRGEIDRIRGVKSGRNSMDVLIFNDWVVPAGRRPGPGNPLTFVTTQKFLEDFNFTDLDSLPDIERLRKEGLINRDLGIDLPTGGEEGDDG